jgi:hypothetical protein
LLHTVFSPSQQRTTQPASFRWLRATGFGALGYGPSLSSCFGVTGRVGAVLACLGVVRSSFFQVSLSVSFVF